MNDAAGLLSRGGWEAIEQQFFGIAFTMASQLSGAGISLLLTLSVIVMSWRGLLHALSAAEGGASFADLIIDCVRLLFFIAIAMGLLDMTGGALGSQNYMNVLIKTFKGYEAIYMSSIDQGVGDITALVVKIPAFFVDAARGPDSSLNLMDAFLNGLQGLSQTVVRLAVMMVLWLAVIIAAIAMMIAYLTGSIIVAVAIAVAPIFVPWIILPATRGFFESWLRFLIGGLVTKVVGVIMLVMTVNVFGKALNSLQDAFDTSMRRGLTSGQGLGSVVDYLLAASNLLIVAFMMIFLMFQVKEMAQSLMSGSLSLSSGARGAGAMAAKSGLGLIKGAVSPTGK